MPATKRLSVISVKAVILCKDQLQFVRDRETITISQQEGTDLKIETERESLPIRERI